MRLLLACCAAALLALAPAEAPAAPSLPGSPTATPAAKRAAKKHRRHPRKRSKRRPATCQQTQAKKKRHRRHARHRPRLTGSVARAKPAATDARRRRRKRRRPRAQQPANCQSAQPQPAPVQPGPLRAGAGRADITPPTGYYMMGWVRSDAKTTGQHTRLYARVLVLESHGQKVALIAEDLNGIPAGMVQDAVKLVADRGFTERNVLDSASHTHAAQTGYYNFGTYDTVFMTTSTPLSFSLAQDPQLYGFMVRQLATAIRHADDDLGPAAVGWGQTQLIGLTQNRSIEAHLANYGFNLPYGQGNPTMDPFGYVNTIDPEVNVLRVDKVGGGRDTPIGIWSTFADHGTVNKFTFHYYNADHHGSATRVVEQSLRVAGSVPASQEVVNAYGNTDEGDQSAGLDHSGPAAADDVGRQEAAKMLEAWRLAGDHLTNDPALGLRWTRLCFCGQMTDGGAAASSGVIGLPQFTGSEEGRGPLYDVTHQNFEGTKLPYDNGAQGNKVPVTNDQLGAVPKAVPLTAMRVDDRMIVSVPGEMTVEMGRRVRSGVQAAVGGAGIHGVVISGLANEYVNYFTTPEEYEAQHYEGGATLFGRFSSNLLRGELIDLAGRLVNGKPAPEAYPFDPINGLKADNTPFDQGAAGANAVSQPGNVAHLQRASFSWQGGPRGFDRPLEKPFVTIRQRADDGSWVSFADDLGLQILWQVDDSGKYTATWEVPLQATPGTYELLITGNRYRLESSPFSVGPIAGITVKPLPSGGDQARVELGYPPNDELRVLAGDGNTLTWHPTTVDGGSVSFLVDGQQVASRHDSGGVFEVSAPAGASVQVPAGGAHDLYGDTNAGAVTIQR